MKLPKHLRHLGGHGNITHVDQGSLEWAVQNLNIKSILDIGCGPGGMLKLSDLLNLENFGIDGDPTIASDKNFLLHDFTTGPATLVKSYDLVWSCEFVEHIEEKFIDNFMKSFQLGKYVILTYAPPNTPGKHHVNCQTAEYWIDVFLKYNFTFDDYVTQEIRKSSTMIRNFVRENGLFFKNKNV